MVRFLGPGDSGGDRKEVTAGLDLMLDSDEADLRDEGGAEIGGGGAYVLRRCKVSRSVKREITETKFLYRISSSSIQSTSSVRTDDPMSAPADISNLSNVRASTFGLDAIESRVIGTRDFANEAIIADGFKPS